KGLAAVDRTPAGDDAVARHFCLFHAELSRAMLDKHVEFLERALVEQKLDTLPRGQLAASVLRRDALLAAAEVCAGARFRGELQDFFHWLLPASTRFPPARARPLPVGKPPSGASLAAYT